MALRRAPSVATSVPAAPRRLCLLWLPAFVALCSTVRQSPLNVAHAVSVVGGLPACVSISLRISEKGEGFAIPPTAPSFMASANTVGLPCAVISTIGSSG